MTWDLCLFGSHLVFEGTITRLMGAGLHGDHGREFAGDYFLGTAFQFTVGRESFPFDLHGGSAYNTGPAE
jgi:hypothetical protein